MCGGGKKKQVQAAPVARPPVDPSAAQRSQAAQEAAQHRVNASQIISSSDSQLPQSFGAELAQ